MEVGVCGRKIYRHAGQVTGQRCTRPVIVLLGAVEEAGCLAGLALNPGTPVAAVEEVAAEILPAEMSYAWTNMSYQEANAGGSAGVFALSMVFVFLILAALYESWTLPWSVLLTTPVAVFGAFLGIWLRGLDNDVFAQIGLIMLIGLVAKNAILLIDFAKLAESRGLTRREAIAQAGRVRLRPILMTTFALIAGIVVGTYSSIFIASPIMLSLQGKFKIDEEEAKRLEARP